MSYMFYNCISFNQDLTNWDVSNCKNMSGMFKYCESFNYDLSKWDVHNVNTFSFMFEGCHELEYLAKIEDSWIRKADRLYLSLTNVQNT